MKEYLIGFFMGLISGVVIYILNSIKAKNKVKKAMTRFLKSKR